MIHQARHRVDLSLDGERLDRALAHSLGWSRGQARRVIALGGVYLAGKRVLTASRRVRAGQGLEAVWAEPPEPQVPPLPSQALLLDRQGLVAVDKPAGVHCQAARHRLKGSLPELVRQLLGLRGAIDPVHRLDRDCSGVVVLGSSKRARRELSALWQSGTVIKRYLALVAGSPAEGELLVDAPLGPAPRGQRGPQAVVTGGQRARTKVRLLQRGPTASLLELRPLTGRRHQLRVHCAHSGWPMLGDRWYAPPEVQSLAPRLCLHAWRLELPPGAVGTPCELEAPLPEDLLAVLQEQGLSWQLGYQPSHS